MTIDEAIEHSKQIAESNECLECGTEHLQLAKWLEELKQLRKDNKILKESLEGLCESGFNEF